MKAQNVGIGTTNPTATLEINGTFKFKDGSEGEGRVLTSNAQGMATWATASSTNQYSDPAGFGTWGQCENPLLSNYQPVLGSKSEDYYGWSVEMNDEFAFVGVPGYDTMGISQGAIFVYTWTGTMWKHDQTLIDPDGANNNYFGLTMDLDSNFLAVSVRFHSAGGMTNIGKVVLFENIGGAWTYHSTFTESTPFSYNLFGYNVAMHKNKLIIGSPNYATLGRVYIYEYAFGSWSLSATLENSSGSAGDFFGEEVAVYNDFVAVAAPRSNLDSLSQGFVKIYQKVGPVFSEIQYLTVQNNRFKKDANFGKNLALHDNKIIISSLKEGQLIYTYNGSLFVDKQRIPKLVYSFMESIYRWNDKYMITNYGNPAIPLVYKTFGQDIEKLLEINLEKRHDFGMNSMAINLNKQFVIGLPFEYGNKGKVLFGKIND